MAFVAGSISKLCEQYSKLGSSEGGQARPATAATNYDLNEVQVVMRARQEVTAEETEYDASLVQAHKDTSDAAQRLAAISAKSDVILSHDLVESAFKSVVAKHDFELVSACAKELETRGRLNDWRHQRNITTLARYPEDKVFHFSLLLLFVVIETAFNAFFFAGSTGLIGGAMIAVSVSLANMFVAAFCGAIFRYVNLPDLKSKLVGYGALLGFVVLALVMNLIFSTFRVQFQLLQLAVVNAGTDGPSTIQLVETLRVAVSEAVGVFLLRFPVVDFDSLLLFVVGIACSIVAFWKGYTFDDKYPGHGDIDRQHKAAEKKFKELKDMAFAEALAEVGAMASDVEGLRQSMLSEQMNLAGLKARCQAAHAHFGTSIKVIQNELDLVLETYRASNRAVRAIPEPAYFSTKVVIAPEFDGVKQLNDFITNLAVVEKSAKELSDSKGKVLGDKVQLIRQQTHQLVQVEFQRILSNITGRAANQIARQAGGANPVAA